MGRGYYGSTQIFPEVYLRESALSALSALSAAYSDSQSDLEVVTNGVEREQSERCEQLYNE
jgi:hypothetical protein